jgi:hypothetical protein
VTGAREHRCEKEHRERTQGKNTGERTQGKEHRGTQVPGRIVS